MIKKVDNESYAKICDIFLNKLILDEKKYDDTIDENFTIKDYFAKLINNPKYNLLGYYIKDKIVGYILIKKLDSESKTCLLDGLYVQEEYRNQKIATKLINEALNISKLEGYNHIDINVMYQNKLAKKLYKKLGFKEFKIYFRKNI